MMRGGSRFNPPVKHASDCPLGDAWHPLYGVLTGCSCAREGYRRKPIWDDAKVTAMKIVARKAVSK